MDVGELTDILRGYPDDLPVVLDGYEGGYGDNIEFKIIQIVRNVHEETYYGPHDDAEDGQEGETVLLLERDDNWPNKEERNAT